jgi:hypothetical protein
MKKFILMVLVASATAIHQPAKAQVSLNINIGAQPRYGYYTDYYARPVVHRSYYAPAPRVVYVNKNNFSKRKYYKPARVYYGRPTSRYYEAKRLSYKHNKYVTKHGRGNGKGRH